MNLSSIVAITGRPGLFKIIARSNKGLIVESLEDKKRLPVSMSQQVALLEDITIYSEGAENIPLKEIFVNIRKKDGDKPAVSHKDDPAKIKDYFSEVAENFDESRVYISDMKKVLKWYDILAPNWVEDSEESPENQSTENSEENTGEQKEA